MNRPVVDVLGVLVPIDQLEEFAELYVRTRLTQRAGNDFDARVWSQLALAARRARLAPVIAASRQESALVVAEAQQIPLTEWAELHRVNHRTARDWAQKGRINAHQGARRQWFTAPDQPPPGRPTP